ncbi:cAMP-dependent protein kinase type II regulatory subunit-like [Ptychodera flava]|uniref:cAMP-dependent protein kinase type II regulatory subunit-like n=1 Tax=Ptychodera flava TaxID=63121 RepID=UPI003969F383
MNFEIPPGLTDLLQEFTVTVLREKPADLVEFAAQYFTKLNDSNTSKTAGRRGVKFSEPSDQDEPMQTDSDEEFVPPELPKNRFNRRKSVCAERYDPEADDDEAEEKVVFPKSDDQRRRLQAAVKNILIFRALDQEQMQEVLDAMFEKKTEPGEHIIEQGDDGDNFYVVDQGVYDIHVNNKNVGAYDNQGSFGELALMYNTPRAATIISSSQGVLWALDRSSFRRIVLKNAARKRKMYEKLIDGVPMLSSLTQFERMNLADALISRTYNAGDQIIRQGDEGDGCYFVESGVVRIAMKNQEDPTKEVEIARCEKGQYFGELALVTHKPRAASAYAAAPNTKCAFIDVAAFERLLGPCMDVMKRNISNYEDQLVKLFGKSIDLSDARS